VKTANTGINYSPAAQQTVSKKTAFILIGSVIAVAAVLFIVVR
jgi:hypothetical protein